jgi:hypothetical protein
MDVESSFLNCLYTNLYHVSIRVVEREIVHARTHKNDSYLHEIVSNLPMHIRIAHLRWSTSRVPTVIHMMLAHEDRVWILVICNLTSVKNEAKNEVPEFSALICLSSVVIVLFCVVFDSIGAQLDRAEALEVVETVPDIVSTEPPSLEGEKTIVALHSCFCIPEPYANRGSTLSCAILMYTSI